MDIHSSPSLNMNSKTILVLSAIAAILLWTNTPGVNSVRPKEGRTTECDEYCNEKMSGLKLEKCCKDIGCKYGGCYPWNDEAKVGAFCKCKGKPKEGRKEECDNVCDGIGNNAEMAKLEKCCKEVAKCKDKKGCYVNSPKEGFSAYCSSC